MDAHKGTIAVAVARVGGAALIHQKEILAGLLPVAKTGDYSDVTVIDGEGRRIPWNDVSHFDDDAMCALTRQIMNRIYKFQVKAEDPAFLKMLDQ